MGWIDRLGTAQRVVIVIALGLALGILASYLTSLGTRTGWYARRCPGRCSSRWALVSLAGFV